MATMTLNQAWHVARQCGKQDFDSPTLAEALRVLAAARAPYNLRQWIERRLQSCSAAD